MWLWLLAAVSAAVFVIHARSSLWFEKPLPGTKFVSGPMQVPLSSYTLTHQHLSVVRDVYVFVCFRPIMVCCLVVWRTPRSCHSLATSTKCFSAVT